MMFWPGVLRECPAKTTDPTECTLEGNGMTAGIAGALLVFTGCWHVFEWMMSSRNRDTLRLIPFGIVYLVLGWLIINIIGGWLTLVATIAIAGAGAALAFSVRNTADIRKWVLWVFIVIDVIIILAAVAALLGN